METKSRTSLKESRERGRQLRQSLPRGCHALWNASRRSDVVTTLVESTVGRLDQITPIRFGRMLASPLAFLRGAPLVMARDLALTPRTKISVQACGDAHLLNFGVFASPERHFLFDINDFDETLTGPWEWDIKRLAASIACAARQRGDCNEWCRDSVRACIRSYREHVLDYSGQHFLEVWYSRVGGEALFNVFPGRRDGEVQYTLRKASAHDNRAAVDDLTHDDAGQLRFKEEPPLIMHAEELLPADRFAVLLESYRDSLSEDRRHLFDRYSLVDYALKVVGVGSVGTRCFAAVFKSNLKHDYIMLQLKEATPSVLERLAGAPWQGNQGRRTVLGQRQIQGFTDVFLGWGTDGERDYYVRQLKDMKGQIDPAFCSAAELCSNAELCGWVLARGHARSGDAALISGYLGKGEAFDDAICLFADAYADQTEADFETFQKAVRSGLLTAEQGI